VRDREQRRPVVKKCGEPVEVEDAVLRRTYRELDAARARGLDEGERDRVMLEVGDDDLAALGVEGEPAADDVRRLGRARCEDDLVGRLRAEEAGRRAPRVLKPVLDLLAEQMRGALAAAAAPVGVEVREACGDGARLERGAGAVEIDEALAADLPPQRRVQRADGLDVEGGRGRRGGRQGAALIRGMGLSSPYTSR